MHPWFHLVPLCNNMADLQQKSLPCCLLAARVGTLSNTEGGANYLRLLGSWLTQGSLHIYMNQITTNSLALPACHDTTLRCVSPRYSDIEHATSISSEVVSPLLSKIDGWNSLVACWHGDPPTYLILLQTYRRCHLLTVARQGADP